MTQMVVPYNCVVSGGEINEKVARVRRPSDRLAIVKSDGQNRETYHDERFILILNSMQPSLPVCVVPNLCWQ